MEDLATGNLRTSLATGQSVREDIRARLPASAELTLLGLVISVLVAMPLGMLAAVKQGSWADQLCLADRQPQSALPGGPFHCRPDPPDGA